MKRILLVMSAHTGAGHKSISDSLVEQFDHMPDVEVKVIEGFELMGGIGVHVANTYGFMARHVPGLFNLLWNVTMAHPQKFAVLALVYRHRFMAHIRAFRPDLILTVHSLFNTVLSRILKTQDLDIPLVVLQADLINIHSSWCNPESYRTICPTREAYDCSVDQGMPPEKLKILPFPTRRRFCNAARAADVKEYDASRPLHCLMMSGGEGSGNIQAFAEAILGTTDASLTIICGRNEKLHRSLQKKLCGKYGSRVDVKGFVGDVEQEMQRCDIMVTRGSPNSMLEAVVMNLPLVIIDSPLGQERDNPRLMEEFGLGVVCRTPAEIPSVLHGLVENDGARLQKIRAAQRNWRSFDNAKNIAVYVSELCEPAAYSV